MLFGLCFRISLSLARQAAIPPPRKFIDMYHFYAKYHRTPSGKVFEIIAKSIQKRFRIYENTSLERWRCRNAISFWFGRGGGCKPRNPQPDLWVPFSATKSQKTWKMQSNNCAWNEHPKTPTLMPKGFQKGTQNRCQNTLKIIAKTSIGQNHENHS